MIRTALSSALVILACSTPVLAESFPVDNPDPHASSWGQRGSFTLYYYGQLNDGTACPPSPNALQFAIIGGGRGLEYLHNYGVDSGVDPALRGPFEKGTFCTLAFDGEVRFLLHHGQQASITPTAVSPVEPVAETGIEGHFTIQYVDPPKCERAPCEPGNYNIILDGVVIADATLIQIEERSASSTTFKSFFGANPPPIEAIDGRLELDGTTATFIIGHDETAAGHYGRYTIRYDAMMCGQAPCPPGRYSILLDGNVVAKPDSIRIEDPLAAAEHFEAQYLPFDEVEGYLELDGTTATILIQN